MPKTKEYKRGDKNRNTFIVIASIIAGCILIAGVVFGIIYLKESGYRTISVQDILGTVNVSGKRNNGQAYIGEHLVDGDDVSVADESALALRIDNDKYLYAEDNTHFVIRAKRSRNGENIRIVLDEGSVMSELNSPLGAHDTYEVDTTTSTMSVRGTSFVVEVYTGDDGLTYTSVEVEKGIVLAQLKDDTGELTGEDRSVEAGDSILIRGDENGASFVDEEEPIEEELTEEAIEEDGSEITEHMKTLYRYLVDPYYTQPEYLPGYDYSEYLFEHMTQYIMSYTDCKPKEFRTEKNEQSTGYHVDLGDTFEYDDDGRVTKLVVTNSSSIDEQNGFADVRFEYDTHGNVIHEKQTPFIENEEFRNNSYSVDCIYDDEEYLMSRTVRFEYAWDDGTIGERIDYEYDQNHNIIGSKRTIMYYEEWGEPPLITVGVSAGYDENGFLARIGEDCRYECDEYGRILREYYSDITGFFADRTTSITYDELGRITGYITVCDDDSTPYTESGTCEFDESGRLIAINIERVGQNDTTLTKTTLTY